MNSGDQPAGGPREDPGAADARLSVEGPVATLRLTRPAVHNVIRTATIGRLETLLARLDGLPEVRVVVLTGSGDATFCAGSDLHELAHLDDRRQALDMSPRMHRVLERLDGGPQVVVGALNGSAYGGGCELLTACHLRIAPSTARFSFRQASLGVTTGWGGGWRLFRLVGRSAALRLLLTAATIEAPEALEMGLVDWLVAPGEVQTAAMELAQTIAANQGSALTGFLELANAVDRQPREQALATERRLFAERWHGDAFWQQVEAWQRRRECKG